MSEFLFRLFVKNKDDYADPSVRARYLSLSGITGIVVNVLLFALKLVLGILAASVAIIADAFNNISDAGSSVLSLIGLRLASKHVDKDHPQGHGRMEYVTGFIVDMLIVLVGFELLKSSFEKILNATLPHVNTLTLVLLCVAIAVKFWLYLFYSKIAKRTASATVKASALDSLTDCIATTLVLVSAIVARCWNIAIDGYAGILVAAFILYSGLKAGKETIDLLLGSPPDPEFIDGIYQFVNAYPHVVGIHDVMVHDYGPGRQIVSFHAEVPSDCDINLAHEEVDKLERDMHEKFGCIVTIHLDPVVLNDPLVNELKALAQDAAKSVHSEFSIHDFRMTKGETQINLIFDLVLPVDCPLSHQDAVQAVADEIVQRDSRCNCVIRAEHPFV